MSYYPCFILDSNKIEIDNQNVKESLKKGDMVIENLIKKYGNKSPVIIKNVANQKEKIEYYYKSKLSLEEIEKELAKSSFKLERQRAFTDYFYENLTLPKRERFKNILKLSKNSYESSYSGICQYSCRI